MRVVSWNIHGCVGGDRRFDPDRIARTLARHGPDVALLQEVGDPRGHHPPFDQASALSRALGMTSTLGVTLRCDPFHYGNLTLTRLPTLAASTYDLSVRGREPRVCLCVEVPLETELVTANVHLGLSRRERRAQLEILVDELGPLFHETNGAPLGLVIIGGDFNDWPPGPVTRTLQGTFTDVAQATSKRPQKTFPSTRPLLRLDRLYVGRDLEPVAFFVDDSREARAASDHLPLVADVQVARRLRHKIG